MFVYAHHYTNTHEVCTHTHKHTCMHARTHERTHAHTRQCSAHTHTHTPADAFDLYILSVVSGHVES